MEQRSGASAYTTTYTYDDVGNRATMVDSTGTTTYAYNAGNRLTLITDPSSNLTTNTYDNNGNLTVTNANGTVTRPSITTSTRCTILLRVIIEVIEGFVKAFMHIGEQMEQGMPQ